MKKFSESELKVFLAQGTMLVQVAQILAVVEEDEPALMAYWVYAKRMRIATDDVTVKAWDRWRSLVDEAGVELPGNYYDIRDKVMNAIWDRLGDDERHRLLHSI